MKTIKIFIILFVSFFSLQLFANPNTDKGLKAYKNKDYKEAFKWLIKPAKQGDKDAQFYLGVMYINGEGVTKDYKQVVKWWTKSAQQDHKKAQYALSTMYNGYGVTKDYKRAVKWLTKSAKQGFKNAQFNLGYMYENGQGVTQDDKQAVKWYTKSAQQGHKYAQKDLALLNKKIKENNERIAKIANDNKCYEQKEYKSCLALARKGKLKAQKLVADMYSTGEKTNKNIKKSLYWYKKAAAQGDKDAQTSLALLNKKAEVNNFLIGLCEISSEHNLNNCGYEYARSQIKDLEPLVFQHYHQNKLSIYIIINPKLFGLPKHNRSNDQAFSVPISYEVITPNRIITNVISGTDCIMKTEYTKKGNDIFSKALPYEGFCGGHNSNKRIANEIQVKEGKQKITYIMDYQ